jgi:two-component system sensor histidine kinase FlrB
MNDSTVPTAEAQRLAEAFSVFNQVSADLSTAYTQLQQQATALTERMALLQDALPAGVLILDGGGRIVQANPAAGRMLADALAITSATTSAGPLEGEMWPEVEQRCLTKSDLPGEFITTEAIQRRLAMTVSALDSGGGRIVLLHDITEAHRLKTQADRNERLAMMGEMVAQLAHQLRTPLAAALLYAGNLENPDLPTTNRVVIAQKTVDRLRHLERLIRDMLMFARGEALGREPIDMHDLLRDIHHTIEPIAHAKMVGFTTSAGTDSIMFSGNRKELAGALENLLENAVQAAGTGGEVVLELRCAPDHLDFVVRDNGVGMETAVVARLFEPFFTTRETGTGLGLAIARGVARAHGGGIEVNSEVGRGTEFIFTIARESRATAERRRNR